MLTALQTLKKFYTDTIVWICAVLCMLILGINVVNVVLRYLTDFSFIYTEDVTVISMLWIMGLGVSVGWWNREHLLINLIDSVLPPKAMDVLMFALDCIGVFVGIAMVYLGRQTQDINRGLKQSLIGFDESFRYWPVIIGGGLLALAAACCVGEQILKWKQGGKK